MLKKADLSDSKKIHALINHFAAKDEMLPRSLSEIYENIRDFFVYKEKGKVCGCCALHICWEGLGEIKSLAVSNNKWGLGIGTKLVEACMDEARKLKLAQAFALTYKPEFFKKLGFKRVPKSKFPHKIWRECINCPKFPNCDEVPMIKEL
ncbi:MAG: GNAT family N-acetyltransferase [Candidatus Omnitrophica bacterium CG07_land_8_20_14_0_80_42_15]|uniref:GNAT family N-acetyltransferase n=1 Tax=Candidatus Aquitaenariimonas noxiae TaxID=1974741 RepID=A0A2J0KR94_9BACT|nr:MAG: GNAT family N-acetyltransferase [Candidatus Omnitrophica bacterium CG07_land_8_20_14_0_80_42_15]